MRTYFVLPLIWVPWKIQARKSTNMFVKFLSFLRMRYLRTVCPNFFLICDLHRILLYHLWLKVGLGLKLGHLNIRFWSGQSLPNYRIEPDILSPDTGTVRTILTCPVQLCILEVYRGIGYVTRTNCPWKRSNRQIRKEQDRKKGGHTRIITKRLKKSIKTNRQRKEK